MQANNTPLVANRFRDANRDLICLFPEFAERNHSFANLDSDLVGVLQRNPIKSSNEAVLFNGHSTSAFKSYLLLWQSAKTSATVKNFFIQAPVERLSTFGAPKPFWSSTRSTVRKSRLNRERSVFCLYVR